MMANLFSSFDPSTNIFSLNWLSSTLLILAMSPMYWLVPSRWNMMWASLLGTMHSELKILVKSDNFKGTTLIFTGLFTSIMLNNFLGLFPYIFTSSSHMSFTLTLSLPLWLSFMMYGWVMNTTHMFAHLVPQGAPSALLPFLVIIETISNIIRPGTLAIRLTANMIAGHLLLTLMGNAGTSLTIPLLSVLVIAQTLLLMLESAVSLIQAYVFSVLTTLYSSETN
uniref:ATP synthase subunit a n=1 Tax=Gnathotrichus materiarius TaxID=1220286 RepID=A0A343A6M7_9CUCU|nr:ATP synthase F0 subunit 6 [Gnathotrichus materiarius]AOY40232.1 ATP synthase F0 subunit 6 [Gnathotrichus materiarius]